VVPEFYSRDEHGVSTRWVARMRESMASLTPQFSANRTVREYTEKHYLVAAETYCQRAASEGKLAAELCAWKRTVDQHWGRVRFGSVSVETANAEHRFQVQAYLDDLPPDATRLELFAPGRDGKEPERWEMRRGESLVGAAGGYLYSVSVPAERPASDYTPRAVAFHPDAIVPLEAREIAWQR
jgi:starch phosphorylase